MYFAYGSPKLLRTGDGGGAAEPVAAVAFGGGELLAVVTRSALQVWSGGRHRLRLGACARPAASVAEEGVNVCAAWCPTRRIVAVAVSAPRFFI
jgi:hypothetical protein